MRFASEAWPFVGAMAALAVVAYFAGGPRWGGLVALLTIGTLLFFRDPDRSYGGDAVDLVAPADGVVTAVEWVEDAAVGAGRLQRISTFLSVFDVHVQRVPVDGRVVHSSYRPGRKVAAFRADAAEVNESHLSVIETDGGRRIGIRQIAGLIARRVVCDLESGERVRRGERLGLIKFGSRVDLLVPEDYTVSVSPKQRLRGGETLVARPPEGAR